MNELELIKESNLINADKDTMMTIVDNYIEDIAHNGGDVLKDWITCEKYAFLIDSLRKSLRPYIIDEVLKYENGETTKYDCNLKVIDGWAKYDFSNNDAWVKQKAVVDEETNKLKNIESFIRNIKDEASILDEETGEVTKYYPAIKKSSTETVRTTIK